MKLSNFLFVSLLKEFFSKISSHLGLSKCATKLLQISRASTFAAIKYTENSEEFLELIEKSVQECDKSKWKQLRTLMELPAKSDQKSFAVTRFLKLELKCIFEEIKKMKFEDFRALPLKQTIGVGQSESLAETSKRCNDGVIMKQGAKRTRLIGLTAEEKVVERINNLSIEFNKGEDIERHLTELQPSPAGSQRWKFECCIDGCKRQQSIYYEGKNNRVHSESYKDHVKRFHSPPAVARPDESMICEDEVNEDENMIVEFLEEEYIDPEVC